MPGIAGIISKSFPEENEQNLNIMVQSMLHEPFYTHGTFFDRENGFYIGYVSLEDSYSDCMPIFNEKKDLVLFLTGECYLDQNVIHDLKKIGHVFNSGNASSLIHLYEEQEDRFLQDLNGWYNGLIIDRREGEAKLFNDRYGIRRIYFHDTGDAFFFSSEAKSLLKAFPFLRELNPQSIGEYLGYDCTFENRTFFKNIQLLPPGSLWNFVNGTVNRKKYFDPHSLENQNVLNQDQFMEELSGTFEKILPRYFSGKSVGLSLTGGLDTRSILACRHPAPGELPCYTFGGSFKDIFDMRLAPRVAKAANQPHIALRLDDKKFLSDYPFYVKRSIYISDGLDNVESADVIEFSKMARQVAPVRMTGIYGSQVLKSVSGLVERLPYEQLIHHQFKKHIHKAHETYRSFEKKDSLSSMLFNEISWWWNGFISSQSSQLTVRSPYLDYDFIKVLYKAPSRKAGIGTRFQHDLIRKNNQKLMSIPTTGTHGGSSSRFVSFLVKNYIKYLMIIDKIYIRERLPYSATHLVGRIDHLLSPFHLERIISGYAEFRRYRVWFRDQLSDFLRETLLNRRVYNRPYWNKNFLIQVVNDHLRGRGTYLREIRKILQVEMLHRVLIEDI
jgi:asparagine synthase (glutamine-hydrolysing)